MKARILILILGMILIFGCAGNQQPESQASGTANTQNTQGTQGGQASATQGSAGSNASHGTAVKPPFSDSISALANLSSPFMCDVSYSYQGKPVLAKLYIKGPSEIRVESPVGVGQCAITITVIKGTAQYVGCDKKEITPGCDWYKSSYDPSKAGSASAFDFSTLDAGAFKCQEWKYDATMFSAKGQSCQLG